MKVFVEAEADDLYEGVKADNRGRITLGSEYANETVSVAVVERESGEE